MSQIMAATTWPVEAESETVWGGTKGVKYLGLYPQCPFSLVITKVSLITPKPLIDPRMAVTALTAFSIPTSSCLFLLLILSLSGLICNPT